MKLGSTELDVYGVCLGGNPFGWTIDEKQSFEVLDAYAEAGGNFIDTADAYSQWVDGNNGGESETIIGNWLSQRQNRDQLVIATKVGSLSTAPGLSGSNVKAALEASLQRLQTDYVDVCYAHRDDEKTPLDEVHEAFNELIAAGKIRHVAASNFSGARLEELLALRGGNGEPWLCGYQAGYNLVERSAYERDVRPSLEAADVPLLPFSALANGFLTGKYRPGRAVDSKRAAIVAPYLESPRNLNVLDAMEAIAKNHQTSVTAVGLAWLRVQPTVATPVASVTKPSQLHALFESTSLELSGEELQTLTQISNGE